MAYKKGETGNRNGRPRGVPNKATKQVKEALLEALNSGAGASEFFKKLKDGCKEDRRTFANLCGRLIPNEITGANGKDLLPTFDPANPRDLLDMAMSIVFVLNRADDTSTNKNRSNKENTALPHLNGHQILADLFNRKAAPEDEILKTTVENKLTGQ